MFVAVTVNFHAFESQENDLIYLNTSRIEAIVPYKDEEGSLHHGVTKIFMCGEDFPVIVKGDPEEIISYIKHGQ